MINYTAMLRRNAKHPPGPPMTLGNMHELGRAPSDTALLLCDALSRALIGWFELASFDFGLSQHSVGTRKAQVPFAILLITYFLRALLVLLRFRQICPCL